MSAAPPVIELTPEECDAILSQAKARLDAAVYEKIAGLIRSYLWVLAQLEAKRTSLRRLRRMLFGAKTERTRDVTRKATGESKGGEDAPAEGGAPACESDDGAEKPSKKKRSGHGRNGTPSYTGAERIEVPHGSLSVGDRCPGCPKGKLYGCEPVVIVRVRGQAALAATAYELERLRCNACGETFRAKAPAVVGEKKYDETAASMIAVLKYGTGMPFYRLERLEGALGIPLPSSTQWEIVEAAAALLTPVHEELIGQAAQGDVLHNDDTTMRMLSRMKELESAPEGERTGTFTSGIVSIAAGRQIALFFTGAQHAGENLADVLARRASGLPPPIQMCDALSRNVHGAWKTVLGNCLAHGRRGFVDVATSFPTEVRHVLEALGEVYGVDARAKKEMLSSQERLRLHQKHSQPVMKDLQEWCTAQIEKKKVEPNSGLGQAISYLLKHWAKLTLFLRVPGAPLDNSICERALKKVVLSRKNAYFYKTENGARVGDLYMSLVYTAELAGVSPFDYLTALQRHADEVREHSELWMPWNYRDTLEALACRAAA